MLVGDDDIREKHLLSFYQTGKTTTPQKGSSQRAEGVSFI